MGLFGNKTIYFVDSENVNEKITAHDKSLNISLVKPLINKIGKNTQIEVIVEPINEPTTCFTPISEAS